MTVKAPFSRTTRGNTLITLSGALIGIGVIFVTTASAFIFVGLGLFMYYYASRLLLELKTVSLNRVELKRECPPRMNEGGTLDVDLTLVNKTVNRLSLEIFDTYPPLTRLREGSNSMLAEVPARGYTQLTYRLATTSVGLQKFGPLRLVLRDVAGLFLYERDVDLGTQVEITPASKELVRGSLAAVQISSYGGALVSSRKGEGTEFADIRNYVHGDPYKRIEWRSTARAGKLMVKDLYAETQLKVMVILDSTSTMSYGEAGETKLDYAARAVASLVSDLGRRGDYVGVTVFNGSAPPVVLPVNKGADHMMMVMRLLSRVSPGSQTQNALGEAIRKALAIGNIGGRTLFFVISDLDSASDLSPIRQLLAMRQEVIMVSPFTPLFESKGLAGLDRYVYSIRTTRELKEREALKKEAAKLGVTVVDVGPKDLFPKLVLRVEELRRMGGS